jgi:serine O-acetyltransferase
MISAEEPDWSREKVRRFWDPSRQLLRSIRRYETAKQRKGVLTPIIRRYWVLSHRFWSVVTQAEIDLTCKIGGGLLIPHPNGIVIHPDAIIGVNCLIMQQVTVGVDGKGESPPVIGGHVDLSAGCKVIGAIYVGDHALVGANAVVTRDVAPRSVVVGIPARPIGSRE